MPSAPLICWDIFMEGYLKKAGLLDDIAQLKKMAALHRWSGQWNMEQPLLQRGSVIVVTDPQLHIFFASSNMPEMNGYLPREVIGKKPGIFQGRETCAITKASVSCAIKELRPFHVSLINYRKSGSSYNCHIKAFPVFNRKAEHTHFIAFENY